jgi:RNA polymerase sigma-70 factor, ECF subfamily
MVEQDDDEAGLIRASIEGDHEAFSTLVRRYQRMIHSLTFRFTCSMSQAEDLAQEAFIQAYQQLDSFRGQSKFSSWLLKCSVGS